MGEKINFCQIFAIIVFFLCYTSSLFGLPEETKETKDQKIRIVIGPTKINFPARLSMFTMGRMLFTRLEMLSWPPACWHVPRNSRVPQP